MEPRAARPTENRRDNRTSRFGFICAAALALILLQQPASAQETQSPPAQPSVTTPQLVQPATPAPVEPAQPDATTAPAAADAAPSQASGTLPHNLSPWGMFMAADWVVKSVMLGLAFASLVTWTVWLAKTLELAGARVRAYRALNAIGSARTLQDAERALEGKGGPGALLVSAAREEVRLSSDTHGHVGPEGLKERVASRLSRIEAQAGRRMSRGTGVLATIGSTAPFVGLFGTVWGIMNSFIGISQSQTTNLAIVAPGIAEALLATAIGLVAAIPAVVIYNVFARSITGYRQLLADASAGVERLVSRDVDFAHLPAARQPRAAAE
ncbi:tonB-system energizer ExbB [Phyllobacterium sp. 0TCS1.6C]|uniref:tonB-system energizer ExbB n=1 Tax=unclassified Phyllobacterium TaxID=2638441 RepID=UPI0022649C1F|nr:MULTISPECIES: tonB-system energizer ExbB [unclassified Phyllobacterium]MCX8279789.1 tonB-system energizer ExbB [Phyllobacterium sp. 0TCS1.6C]MCX8295607.1 tonB-system energizer ExbB [Phyllobacterium sp. 0TCS1.6A]